MSITGYYDGTAVQIAMPLQLNQKVLIIPIETDDDVNETAAGGLHKYANPELIAEEKDAWRKAAIKKNG